jgi:hypothetical protein
VTGESNGAPVLSAVTDVDLYTVVADAEPVSFDSFAVNANEQIKKARSAHESCVEPNPVLATLSVAEPQATEKRYAESKALLSELDGCKVRLGMDEAEVIALLGQPTAIQRQSEWQVLTFGRASNTGTFPSPIVHVTLTPDGVRAVDSQYVPGH